MASWRDKYDEHWPCFDFGGVWNRVKKGNKWGCTYGRWSAEEKEIVPCIYDGMWFVAGDKEFLAVQLTEKNRKKIIVIDKEGKYPTQKDWNKMVADGEYELLNYAKKETLKAVPHVYWAARFAKEFTSAIFRDKVIKVFNNAPESAHVHVSVEETELPISNNMKKYSKKHAKIYLKENPLLKSKDETILNQTIDAKVEAGEDDVVDKYISGEIQNISDINPIAFVNDHNVIRIIEAAHAKARQQFEEVCVKHGYKSNYQIPDELVKSFSKKLQEIDSEINEKRVYATKEILTDIVMKTVKNDNQKAKDAADEFSNMGV